MQMTLRGGTTRIQSFSVWFGNKDPEDLFKIEPTTFKTHAMNFLNTALEKDALKDTIIAGKDAVIASKDVIVNTALEKDALKDTIIAGKDAVIASKDAIIVSKDVIVMIQNQAITRQEKQILELELEKLTSASKHHAVVANRVVLEAGLRNYDARYVATNHGSIPKLTGRYKEFLFEYVLDQKNLKALSKSSQVFLRNINNVTNLASPTVSKIVDELEILIDTVSEPLHNNFRTAHGIDPSICMSGNPVLATVLALVVLHLQKQKLWNETILILDHQLVSLCKLVGGSVFNA
jgi:hypothetical protein